MPVTAPYYSQHSGDIRYSGAYYLLQPMNVIHLSNKMNLNIVAKQKWYFNYLYFI